MKNSEITTRESSIEGSQQQQDPICFIEKNHTNRCNAANITYSYSYSYSSCYQLMRFPNTPDQVSIDLVSHILNWAYRTYRIAVLPHRVKSIKTHTMQGFFFAPLIAMIDWFVEGYPKFKLFCFFFDQRTWASCSFVFCYTCMYSMYVAPFSSMPSIWSLHEALAMSVRCANAGIWLAFSSTTRTSWYSSVIRIMMYWNEDIWSAEFKANCTVVVTNQLSKINANGACQASLPLAVLRVLQMLALERAG